jgi:hypothetical protein
VIWMVFAAGMMLGCSIGFVLASLMVMAKDN